MDSGDVISSKRKKAQKSRTIDEIWQKVYEQLENLLGTATCSRWFQAASLQRDETGLAVILVPNEIHQLWIEMNYMDELRASMIGHVQEPVELRLEIVEEEEEEPIEEEGQAELFSEQETRSTEKRGLKQIQEKAKSRKIGLNSAYVFDSFVVGTNSQFAYAACEAVAQGRGEGYNPLFIHGGPGLGKTHLMQAVGAEWLKRIPSDKVIYLTCEQFTNEYIEALRDRASSKFRNRYRKAELMLIDDVQFLASKGKTQEEFFHTFQALLDGHCQVILTSDRPASEIQKLEPRLMSRFECGLTVELQRPGYMTRLAILQKKVEEWGISIDEAILQILAKRLRTNVRRLEGGLMRVGTYASLAGEQVTVEKAEHLLRDLFREEKQQVVTIDRIQRIVSEQYDIRLADMTSRRRPASIAFPRQIAMYLSRTMTPCSLVEIGEAFGGRDHGTVIHAVRKIQDILKENDSLRERVEQLEMDLGGTQRYS